MQALYFKWQSVRTSRANKVILFYINRAVFCEQTNNFNVCKYVRMASNIYSVLSELDKEKLKLFFRNSDTASTLDPRASLDKEPV